MTTGERRTQEASTRDRRRAAGRAEEAAAGTEGVEEHQQSRLVHRGRESKRRECAG